VHGANASRIAELLNADPAVAKVFYPGLSTHPQHALAVTQQAGFGAMVSFELRGGLAEVAAFLDGLTCFSLAESLGGVESLVAHPASMTHAGMAVEARQRAGISDALLRLSVGIEDIEDLSSDLHRGLERARRVKSA
jgi:cystathionine gamma-synthase